MDNAQLRRELAELLGAKFDHLGFDKNGIMLYHACKVTYRGKDGYGWNYDEAMTQAGVPDTNDPGEALARLAWEYYRGAGKC